MELILKSPFAVGLLEVCSSESCIADTSYKRFTMFKTLEGVGFCNGSHIIRSVVTPVTK